MNNIDFRTLLLQQLSVQKRPHISPEERSLKYEQKEVFI